MQKSNVEIRVLIKGKPIQEYYHNGGNFVEGREGSPFELELINRNPFRVEAVVSVDGLSVIDGKEAGVHSSGYLVEGGDTLRIPGWKLNDEAIAKFVFSGKGQSYSTAMTGSASNNGVIGAMVFAESGRRAFVTGTKVRQELPRYITPHYGIPRSTFGSARGYVPTGPNAAQFGSTVWHSGNTGMGSGLDADVLDGFHGASFNTMACSAAASASAATQSATSAACSASTARSMVSEAVSLNNLGTGFGEVGTFETEVTSFNRGDMIAMLVFYYDNARGLKARGIQVGRPARVKHTASTPQAFPGMNCAPPPGWRA
jgi:hypothetical protein